MDRGAHELAIAVGKECALAERKQIVVWLRNRALPMACRADQDIADAIEAGKHLINNNGG